LIGEALEHFWLFGRIANQIIVPAPDPISAGSALEKRSWLGKNLQTTKARGDGWASVYVGSNPALSDQYRAAVEKLDGHSPPSPPANPMSLRMEVVGALMAGAKGILYKTQSPLLDPISSQSPDDLALQAALRWTNHELKLWSPWIAYGQQQSAPQLSRADFAGALWRVRDADLIVAQNVGAYSQQCLPATRNTPLRITLPGTSEPHQVFRLSESRLELLRLERTAGDESWQVESPNPIEILVVTGNPQVTNYLRQQLNRQSTEVASDQLELANYYLQQASELIEARFGVSNGGSSEELRARSIQQQRITANQRLLERGWQALQANQTADASSLALQSLDQTRAVLHESFLVAIENLASPQASPLVLTPGTLKYHWLLANACQRSTWQTLELPGSQFSNLETMQSSGWHQERRLKDQVDFRVELIPADNSTSAGLRLAAYPKTRATLNFDPVPGGYEGASLFVRSAGAPVRKGQLVRVSAVATIREVGNDPAAGLLIYDNQAWTSLGQLIRGKPGERIPVELYRFVIQDGEFRIQAECRGLCDVQLEMLQASVIEPATNFRRYDTVPREPVSSDEYSDASAQLKSVLTPVPR
jgi:hypothetical protein